MSALAKEIGRSKGCETWQGGEYTMGDCECVHPRGGGDRKISLNYLRSSVKVTRTIKTFCNASSYQPSSIPSANHPADVPTWWTSWQTSWQMLRRKSQYTALIACCLISCQLQRTGVFYLPKDSSFSCAPRLVSATPSAHRGSQVCKRRGVTSIAGDSYCWLLAASNLQATTRDLLPSGY